VIRKSDYLRDKNAGFVPIGQTVSMVAEWYLKIQLKMWLKDEKTAYLLHPFTTYARQKWSSRLQRRYRQVVLLLNPCR